MITLELSEYCLYSGWPKWLLAGWGFCGHFLAQSSMGLLLFSPVIEKMRNVIIAPCMKNVAHIREQVEKDFGSFTDLADVEKNQYKCLLGEIDRIVETLKEDAEAITLGSYKICLIGALLAVVAMTMSADVFAGPATLLLLWPFRTLTKRLAARAESSEKEAQDYYRTIQFLKSTHSKTNAQSGLSAVDSLPEPTGSSSSPAQTAQRQN